MRLIYKPVVLSALLLFSLLVSCKTDTVEKVHKESAPKDSIFYGINFNQFEVARDTIKKNETFGQIMHRNNIGSFPNRRVNPPLQTFFIDHA